MKYLSYLLIALLFALISSCNTTEPPVDDSALSLSVEDVSCTEAWLRISKFSPKSIYVNIERNDEELFSFSLTNNDTILQDKELAPGKNYTYQATNLSGKLLARTTITTMDTTSHLLNWENITFGEGNFRASYLNDVAIINENNIWAVGAIYLTDSLGNDDSTPYNAIHWDGNKWEYFRIQFYDFCGRNSTSAYPAKSIYALSKNTILISANSQLSYIKNNLQLKTECIPISVSKIWANSSDNIYIAGSGINGNLAHYNGQNWEILESTTEITLTDIYGLPDGKTIWASGWDYDNPGSTILQIENLQVKEIWDGLSINGEYNFAINSVWAARSEFWTAGVLIFRQSTLFPDVGHLVRYPNNKLFEPGNFVLSLRGTDYNNVYASGDLGMVWHFNGSSWHKYEELYNPEFDRRINGMAVKENIVVTAGWKGSKAWIAIGKK